LNTPAPAFYRAGASAFRRYLNARLKLSKGDIKFVIGDTLDLARAQFFVAAFQRCKRNGFAERDDRVFEQFISEPNPLRPW